MGNNQQHQLPVGLIYHGSKLRKKGLTLFLCAKPANMTQHDTNHPTVTDQKTRPFTVRKHF